MRISRFFNAFKALLAGYIMVSCATILATQLDVECEQRLAAIASKPHPERAAVLWTIIQDQVRADDKWNHILMGTKAEPQFAVPTDHVFKVAPDARHESILAFLDALHSALDKIEHEEHPQLFIAIDAHGSFFTFGTHIENGWSIDHDFVRKVIVEAIAAKPGLESRLQLNLCIDACHGFAGFKDFSKIRAPVHMVGASNAERIAISNVMVPSLIPINRIAAVALGRAPNVHDLARFQRLLGSDDSHWSIVWDEGDVSNSTAGGLEEWTPAELKSALAYLNHTAQASRTALRFYRAFPEECEAWAQAALQSANPIEAEVARRVLKYSALNDWSIQYLQVKTADVVGAGLELENRNDIAARERAALAAFMPAGEVLPQTAPTFLDAILVAKFSADLGPEKKAFYDAYEVALLQHEGGPPARKAIVLQAFDDLARVTHKSQKKYYLNNLVRGERNFAKMYEQAFEAQFRSGDFLKFPRDKQEAVAKAARSGDIAFEDAP